MTFLDDGLKRVSLVADAVEKVKNQVATVKMYENFIHPVQQSARQECLQELRKIVDLLDIQPFYHPIRTMLLAYALEHAEQIRACLDDDQLDITAGTEPVWRMLWDSIQPTSAAMWAFDTGCVCGRTSIRHMLTSKRLADRFEEGGQVDDSMYSEIIPGLGSQRAGLAC